eukprot:GGOE01046156.1.p1 GENE.GGOE01046156.1~~GGOE01046156.1.p1  ORF type:complete len:248 (-),score=30.69 GGOE01046156.1:159-881(-)
MTTSLVDEAFHQEDDETVASFLKVFEETDASLKKRSRLGHVDEFAAQGAFFLDPKERPKNYCAEAEKFVMDFGVPFLVHQRFGDISHWQEERLNEAKTFLGVKLQGQLNLYRLQMNPSADSEVSMSNHVLYWESKLGVAQELAECALFLFSVPITEAAVERTFSVQKFVDTPLRNALQDELVQSMLFVKFNFLNFGEKSLIPPKLLQPIKYFYRHDLDMGEETPSNSASPVSNSDPLSVL